MGYGAFAERADARMNARVAIVDYGMGNLFSVKHACKRVGLMAFVTSTPTEIESADAVIVPGVGAFGDAMDALRAKGLVEVLKETASSGKPMLGICLGMQLLMEVSYEFGRHEGLGIVRGSVERLGHPRGPRGPLKVPQVGWNQIHPPPGTTSPWVGTLLDGVGEGAYMYFVHSFYVRPEDPGVIASVTRYGDFEFCSTLVMGNIFACQYHPERSGPVGLRLYENLARRLMASERRRC